MNKYMNFLAGAAMIFLPLFLVFVITMISLSFWNQEGSRDIQQQAVDRGFGQWVIKNAETKFEWNVKP